MFRICKLVSSDSYDEFAFMRQEVWEWYLLPLASYDISDMIEMKIYVEKLLELGFHVEYAFVEYWIVIYNKELVRKILYL